MADPTAPEAPVAPPSTTAEPCSDTTTPPTTTTTTTTTDTANPPIPLSKNQLKKQLKKQAWTDQAAARKQHKREKRKASLLQKRTERDSILAAAAASGHPDPLSVLHATPGFESPHKTNINSHHDDSPHQPRPRRTLVPVSLILDCDFEEYMLEKELVSLAGQVTRSYSQNRASRLQFHLLVNGWKEGSKMRERFETVMGGAHGHWRGVQFVEGDYVEAGKQAHELMVSKKGGEVIEVLSGRGEIPTSAGETQSEPTPAQAQTPPTEPQIIYLTADSPHTLTKLEPYTSYVIGGLVDRNREKGICYKRALDKNIKTAKLPIGEYMKMASRQVLATNHVVEIMVKWLETGDWGKAFMAIIPKRKGGLLKGVEEEKAIEGENVQDPVEQSSTPVDEEVAKPGDFEPNTVEEPRKDDT